MRPAHLGGMKRALPLFALLVLSRLAHADPAAAREPRTVPAFHAIDLAGTLEVEIELGKPASVELVGDAELFAKVSTSVKNGVLVIDTKFPRDQHGDHHIKALISAPDASSLSITGTGAMKVTGIANDRLALSVPGTGEIKATGSTGTLHVSVDGTGDISAKQLTSKAATVEVRGTGAASLNATESVEAIVTGTGSISVHGHPARVKKSVTGLGSIHIR
jgi:hypothetical protein